MKHYLPCAGCGSVRCPSCRRAWVEVRSGVCKVRPARGPVSPGLHCYVTVGSLLLGGCVGSEPASVVKRVSAVPAAAPRACPWWEATGVGLLSRFSFLEVLTMGYPEPAQSFADAGNACGRLPSLY